MSDLTGETPSDDETGGEDLGESSTGSSCQAPVARQAEEVEVSEEDGRAVEVSEEDSGLMVDKSDDLTTMPAGATRRASQGASRRTAVTRLQSLVRGWLVRAKRASAAAPVVPQLRLLIWVCSPRIARLPQAGSEAVDIMVASNLGLAVETRWGGTAAALDEALRCLRPAHFHFVGHCDLPTSGRQGRTLAFTSPGGVVELHPPELLASMLASHTSLKLVFLNGCCSAALGRAAHAPGVGAVVCWESKCLDAAAKVFAARFFEAVARAEAAAADFKWDDDDDTWGAPGQGPVVPVASSAQPCRGPAAFQSTCELAVTGSGANVIGHAAGHCCVGPPRQRLYREAFLYAKRQVELVTRAVRLSPSGLEARAARFELRCPSQPPTERPWSPLPMAAGVPLLIDADGELR